MTFPVSRQMQFAQINICGVSGEECIKSSDKDIPFFLGGAQILHTEQKLVKTVVAWRRVLLICCKNYGLLIRRTFIDEMHIRATYSNRSALWLSLQEKHQKCSCLLIEDQQSGHVWSESLSDTPSLVGTFLNLKKGPPGCA